MRPNLAIPTLGDLSPAVSRTEWCEECGRILRSGVCIHCQIAARGACTNCHRAPLPETGEPFCVPCQIQQKQRQIQSQMDELLPAQHKAGCEAILSEYQRDMRVLADVFRRSTFSIVGNICRQSSYFPASLYSAREFDLIAAQGMLATSTPIRDSAATEMIKNLILDTTIPAHRGHSCSEAISLLDCVQNNNLAISRELIPNNIVTACNYSKPAYTEPVAESFRLNREGMKKPFLGWKQYQPHITPSPWHAESPFLKMQSLLKNRHFLAMISTNTRWAEDLEPLTDFKKAIDCPVPIFRSKSTGDYWMIGWHGSSVNGIASSHDEANTDPFDEYGNLRHRTIPRVGM